MRFVIIYPNREDVRAKICEIISGEIKKGRDFFKSKIEAPFFRTSILWPTSREIAAMPFNWQVEEINYENENITSLKKLIIDIEVEIIHDNPAKQNR